MSKYKEAQKYIKRMEADNACFTVDMYDVTMEALHIAHKYEEEKKGLDGWVSYLQGRVKELEKRINM